jgi:hypothetical protein
LNAVCKRLEFEDTMASRHAAPITYKILMDVLYSIDWRDQQEFLSVMLMFIAHDGLLRSCEMFTQLRSSSIEWVDSDRCFILTVLRSKANQAGDPEYVRVCDHHGPSAYKMLRLWFDLHHLWRDSTKFLIPRVVWLSRRGQGNKYRLDFTQEGTRYWWDNIIKVRVEKVGLDPKKYTGHSFRPGGTTDLFAVGVSYPVVKLMGRWGTDTAIIYMRDAMEVAKISAAAFGHLARKQQSGVGVWEGPRGDFHIA